MDLLIELAASVDAPIALANDPDADRLAAAIPVRSPATSPADWRRLGGDEIGWLLADHILRHTSGDDRLVITTLVSSSLLGRMAARHGVHSAETFTGFKWIGHTVLERPDERFVFGYEQALGYLVCDRPLDKDGITAGILLAEVAALAAEEGTTLQERLDAIVDAVRPPPHRRPVGAARAQRRGWPRCPAPRNRHRRGRRSCRHVGRVVPRGRVAAAAAGRRTAVAGAPQRHRAEGEAVRRRVSASSLAPTSTRSPRCWSDRPTSRSPRVRSDGPARSGPPASRCSTHASGSAGSTKRQDDELRRADRDERVDGRHQRVPVGGHQHRRIVEVGSALGQPGQQRVGHRAVGVGDERAVVVVVDGAVVLGQRALDDLAAACRVVRRDEAGQPAVGQPPDPAQLRRGDAAQPHVEVLLVRLRQHPQIVVVVAGTVMGDRLRRSSTRAARPCSRRTTRRARCARPRTPAARAGSATPSPNAGSTRPCDSRSSVASSLASTTGLRPGSTITLMPNFSLRGAAGGERHRHQRDRVPRRRAAR